MPLTVSVHCYTCLKNDVISSGQKHYCALGLGLVEMRFRSNIFSSKYSRSDIWNIRIEKLILNNKLWEIAPKFYRESYFLRDSGHIQSSYVHLTKEQGLML